MENSCIFVENIMITDENNTEFKKYLNEALSYIFDYCMMHGSDRSKINPHVCQKIE